MVQANIEILSCAESELDFMNDIIKRENAGHTNIKSYNCSTLDNPRLSFDWNGMRLNPLRDYQMTKFIVQQVSASRILQDAASFVVSSLDSLKNKENEHLTNTTTTSSSTDKIHVLFYCKGHQRSVAMAEAFSLEVLRLNINYLRVFVYHHNISFWEGKNDYIWEYRDCPHQKESLTSTDGEQKSQISSILEEISAENYPWSPFEEKTSSILNEKLKKKHFGLKSERSYDINRTDEVDFYSGLLFYENRMLHIRSREYKTKERDLLGLFSSPVSSYNQNHDRRTDKHGKLHIGAGILPFCSDIVNGVKNVYILGALHSNRRVGFFGGLCDTDDADLIVTAAREAEEESNGIFYAKEIENYVRSNEFDLNGSCFVVYMGELSPEQRKKVLDKFNRRKNNEIISVIWIHQSEIDSRQFDKRSIFSKLTPKFLSSLSSGKLDTLPPLRMKL